MNRKIKLSLITLLSIGSISIASLPLVSCGSSETTPTPPPTPPTPVVPTLDTESAKLKSQTTKIKNQSASFVKKSMDNAKNKDTELAKYYDLVKLAEGFSYKYESSNVENSTLNITV